MVSIIMPCYNVEKYVLRSIQSIQSQTDPDWELILINDGSTDNTDEIIRKCAAQDKRIHIISQENGGVSRARNVGLDMAKGEYICPLDGDDWLEPDCLALAVQRIRETNCEVCFFGSKEVDEQGSVLRDYEQYAVYPDQKVLDNDEMLYQKSLRKFWIHTGNAIFKSDLVNEHHIRYREGFRYGEDSHFINSCLRFANKITFVKKTLMAVMIRDGSATHSGIAASYIDAVHLNREFYHSVAEDEKNQKILLSCDIDFIQLLTASAKNVVDHLSILHYRKAKRYWKEFGILDIPRDVDPDAVKVLPKAKRLEWQWFCLSPFLFFCSVKAYRLFKK